MKRLIRLFAAAGLAVCLYASPAEADPFFVKVKEAALGRARALGIELRVFSGGYDGDTRSQVEAIERLIASGAKGILITPSNPDALIDAVRKAREAGVFVVALDTPFGPADSVDATFATDNFRAGKLIGAWAWARLGASAKNARIVTLDGAGTGVTVEVLRNQGFLEGFGIDIGDPGRMYDGDDARIVGRGASGGTREGGRAAMEKLLREKPGIDLVYAINEPAAAGAHAAIDGSGMENDALIVSVDGGCEGARNVAAGALGATAMQFPLRMAQLGVEVVVEFVRTGRKPVNTPGLNFHDTGVSLVTDEPVRGVPSISTERALEDCWG